MMDLATYTAELNTPPLLVGAFFASACLRQTLNRGSQLNGFALMMTLGVMYSICNVSAGP